MQASAIIYLYVVQYHGGKNNRELITNRQGSER